MTTEYITPRQLAELLGVPLGTVRDWHRRGVAPPHYKIGGLIRYRPAEVEQWLAERHRPGNDTTRR